MVGPGCVRRGARTHDYGEGPVTTGLGVEKAFVDSQRGGRLVKNE